ncbi:hypothetical protein VP01_499g1 [Puccinia sorghi]|uniref:Uncharacterized protein n=1 Tax=Puccinia sorghi TaxID=27349 RepID=A0A0L6ULS5_9BASI|nr:hypothetical protein VP01_499g1 [Puccinia sorghi]
MTQTCSIKISLKILFVIFAKQPFLHHISLLKKMNFYQERRYNSIINFHFFHLSCQGFFILNLTIHNLITKKKKMKLFLNIYTGNCSLLFKPLEVLATPGKPLWCGQYCHLPLSPRIKPLNWHCTTAIFELRIVDKSFMIGMNSFNPLIYKTVATQVFLICRRKPIRHAWTHSRHQIGDKCNSSKYEMIDVTAATTYLMSDLDLFVDSLEEFKIWNLPVGTTNTTELLEFLPSTLSADFHPQASVFFLVHMYLITWLLPRNSPNDSQEKNINRTNKRSGNLEFNYISFTGCFAKMINKILKQYLWNMLYITLCTKNNQKFLGMNEKCFTVYQAIHHQSINSQIKKDLIENQWKLHEKRFRKKAAMGMNQGSDNFISSKSCIFVIRFCKTSHFISFISSHRKIKTS